MFSQSLEHNQSYQTPRLLFLFLLISEVLQYLSERVANGAALACGSCLTRLSSNFRTDQIANRE